MEEVAPGKLFPQDFSRTLLSYFQQNEVRIDDLRREEQSLGIVFSLFCQQH